jgi:mono/diheme cytochrome c family protein
MPLRQALYGLMIGFWWLGPFTKDVAADQISEGASMARDACSACHQVSPQQKPPPPVFDRDQEVGIAAPSFMKIARNPRMSAARLRKVIAEPHYPMREQMLDPEDRNALIAYILSLRPSRPAQ